MLFHFALLRKLLRSARNSLAKKRAHLFGKPFQIVYVITQNVTGLPKGKYDGDGCVLFVSLKTPAFRQKRKNKRDTLKSKINFQLFTCQQRK